jgi:PAS domain S-box-containing protein
MQKTDFTKNPMKMRALLKRFLIFFIPAVTLSCIISFAFYSTDQQSRKKNLESQEMFNISQQQKIIRNDIKNIIADLLLMVHHYHLHSIIEGDFAFGFDTISKEFLIFAQQKKIYDQVRYLDKNGMEIIRVNYNNGRPAIVPNDRLQSKGKRYYFEDTIKLQEGEVFVSPFDLNIEKGAIEEPRKPMIRFAAPVFGSDGRKFGIIILNYIGNEILNGIDLLGSHSFGELMLLNQNGYWLRGPNLDEEWGFMYKDKTDISFAHHFPAAWDKIHQNDSGLFCDENGMYAFVSVYPLKEGLKSSTGSPEAYQRSASSLKAHDYCWKIISHIPTKDLNELLSHNRIFLITLNVFLAFIIAIVCWLAVYAGLKRQMAELELEESEQKFRTIADFSYDWEAWIRPDDSYLYVSPSCERISGYPQASFMDNSDFLLEIAHPDDLEMLASHLRKHLDHGFKKAEIHFRIITKSGEIRWIWHQCQAVYSEQGDWLGRRTTNRDITEKHHIATLLQRERDMFLHGPVVTFTWQNKENWPVERVSKNVINFLGYEAEDFLNGSTLYASCIHPEDLQRVMTEATTSSSDNTESFSHLPYRLITRNGETVWVLGTTSIVRDDHGNISHYLGYLVDISVQKNQEQLVLDAVKQQERLRRLESLKTMAGAIAHHFNNAMMIVQGYLDLVDQTLPAGSNEKQMMSQALQGADKASRMGTMMLTYVGQSPRQLQSVSLPDLVRETITELQDRLPPSIALRLEPPREKFICKMDQQQIKEVINSSINNAIEALEKSEGIIEVTFGTNYFETESFPMPFQDDCLKNGLFVFCQIRDTGHGINAQDIQQIFEPFFTTRFTGRGLGLALAVGIMRSHHGALTVESTPGKGTTVRILLPALADE